MKCLWTYGCRGPYLDHTVSYPALHNEGWALLVSQKDGKEFFLLMRMGSDAVHVSCLMHCCLHDCLKYSECFQWEDNAGIVDSLLQTLRARSTSRRWAVYRGWMIGSCGPKRNGSSVEEGCMHHSRLQSRINEAWQIWESKIWLRIWLRLLESSSIITTIIDYCYILIYIIIFQSTSWISCCDKNSQPLGVDRPSRRPRASRIPWPGRNIISICQAWPWWTRVNSQASAVNSIDQSSQ